MLEQIRMACVVQQLYGKRVDDVVGEVKRRLQRLNIADRLKGKRIAITAGSRGIARIHEVIKDVAEFVKESGGEPFVFPAMGSHGGATGRLLRRRRVFRLTRFRRARWAAQAKIAKSSSSLT